MGDLKLRKLDRILHFIHLIHPLNEGNVTDDLAVGEGEEQPGFPIALASQDRGVKALLPVKRSCNDPFLSSSLLDPQTSSDGDLLNFFVNIIPIISFPVKKPKEAKPQCSPPRRQSRHEVPHFQIAAGR